MVEDDIHVLNGPPPFAKISEDALGVQYYRNFMAMPMNSLSMIDAFTNEKLPYTTLLERSVKLADALRSKGYHGQSTILSISSENSLDFFVPVFASFYNLSILAPLNQAYTSYELEHCLKISSPKVVFCSQAVASKFVELKKKLEFIEWIILIGSKCFVEGTTHLDDFITNIEVNSFKPLEGDPAKLCALILCSSGTTGLPKGVAVSHLGINVRIAQDKDPIFEGKGRDNSLGLMPFFHGFGMIVSLTSILKGSTLIVFKRFDEDLFLKSIQDYKMSTLYLAPTLALFLAKSDKVFKYDLNSVETIYCGAAPLSGNIEKEVKTRLNFNDFRQAYGLTEMTLIVSLGEKGCQRHGSSGKPISYVKLKIRDVTSGKSLGPNQPGEICCKGPTVMLGYYNNPEATKTTFTSDGWLRTGDIAYYDNDGYIFVIDRLKELIKYKGYQVAPAELEAILLSHPKIADAGVVGLPDETVGEKPLAFVVKKVGQDISESDIQQFVAGLVSPQKRLSGGVIFVDNIPKNPTGKILRKELRLQLKKYFKSKL